jgi:hypothetical protein
VTKSRDSATFLSFLATMFFFPFHQTLQVHISQSTGVTHGLSSGDDVDAEGIPLVSVAERWCGGVADVFIEFRAAGCRERSGG